MNALRVSRLYPALHGFMDVDAFLLVLLDELLGHFEAQLLRNEAGYAGKLLPFIPILMSILQKRYSLGKIH
jgi:hypothetical protein